MSDKPRTGDGTVKPTRWTVQVMPDGGGEIRTLRVTRRTVRVATAASVLLAILLLGFVASLSVGTVREVQLARLRLENQHLRENLTEVERQMVLVGDAIDELSDRDQRSRLLAGLPLIDPDVRAVGVGGPVAGDPSREEFLAASPEVAERTLAAAYDVDRLLRRTELLSSSMDEALDSVAVHEQVFLARPSIRPLQTEEAWISSSFSRSRFHPVLLVNRPHPGVDISAASGTPILATGRGVVTFVGTKAGYGKTVEIDHGFGYVTLYAHAGSLNVKRGQRVERGDVIGAVGQTGLATAPHLHYEILLDGKPVNPAHYMLDERVY
jgi:murein DD-endopeptidase MepM/ murein hydrolase activator NlpD